MLLILYKANSFILKSFILDRSDTLVIHTNTLIVRFYAQNKNKKTSRYPKTTSRQGTTLDTKLDEYNFYINAANISRKNQNTYSSPNPDPTRGINAILLINLNSKKILPLHIS